MALLPWPLDPLGMLSWGFLSRAGISTWALSDSTYAGSPATTGAGANVGYVVRTQPVVAPPGSSLYLMANTADGLLHPVSAPWPSAVIDANGHIAIAALPCASLGTQDPANTPWQIVVPNAFGGTDTWQGVPPSLPGTYSLEDLHNGQGGAGLWVVVPPV